MHSISNDEFGFEIMKML